MSDHNEYTVAFPGSGANDRSRPDNDAYDRAYATDSNAKDRCASDASSESTRQLRLSAPSEPTPFPFRELNDVADEQPVVVRLGTTYRNGSSAEIVSGNMPPRQVISLDQAVDQPVELSVGGCLIAFGRLVVMQDKVAIEVTELVAFDDRLRHAS